MAVTVLPPPLEAVRQALLVPPPAVIRSFDPSLPGSVKGHLSALNVLIKTTRDTLSASDDLIRSAVNNLGPQLQAGSITVEQIAEVRPRFDEAIEAAADLLQSVERDQAELISVAKRAGFASAYKQGFRKLNDVLAMHYNSVVQSYYLMLAFEAEHDPTSREVVSVTSSPEEVDAFFASLRA